jgi:hypothetical protein
MDVREEEEERERGRDEREGRKSMGGRSEGRTKGGRKGVEGREGERLSEISK